MPLLNVVAINWMLGRIRDGLPALDRQRRRLTQAITVLTLGLLVNLMRWRDLEIPWENIETHFVPASRPSEIVYGLQLLLMIAGVCLTVWALPTGAHTQEIGRARSTDRAGAVF